MKAFIVDDDPIVLVMIAHMLYEEGVDTKYCTAPVDSSFYEEIEHFKPDIIILDLYLKNQSGIEIAKKLRCIESLKDTAIIAVSSSRDVEDKLSAFTSGFMDYINKPFTKKEFISKVMKYKHSSNIIRLCDKINKRQELDNELYP